MKKLVFALVAALMTAFSVRATELKVSPATQDAINTQMAEFVQKLRDNGLQNDIKNFLRTQGGIVPTKQAAFLRTAQSYLDAGASYEQVKRDNNTTLTDAIRDQINNSTVPNNPPVAAGKRPKWCDFANAVLNFAAEIICSNNGIKWTPIDFFSWWP